MLRRLIFRFDTKNKIGIFLFFLIFSFIVCGQSVLATTVFSPIIELEVEPGQKQSGVVKVYNETEQDLYLLASIESFKARDEDGQPEYIAPEQKDIFLKWFILAQDDVTLKPSQAIIIPFIVDVPKDATPGGYYAVIFWKDQRGPSDKNNAINISSKVGTLILLKVKGALNEQGELTDFKTQPEQKYFFKLPISFLVRFQNNGNIHLKPSGEIKLRNLWFGQQNILEVNEAQRNVLPSSARKFEIYWGQTFSGGWFNQFWSNLDQEVRNFTVGPYLATLELEYGSDKMQKINQEITFWLIPYHLIILLALIIVVLVILFKVNKKIKRIKQGEKNNILQ